MPGTSGPHRPPLAKYLAESRARLESGTLTRNAAEQLRRKCRYRCKEEGLAIPEWCENRKRGGSPQSPPKVEAPLAAAPLSAVTMPPELRAWREARPGAVVQVTRSGVVLDSFAEGRRTFPSIEAALAAL